MPFTLFDLALVLIMGLSGLLAMLRGFSREMMSLASWGLAAGASYYMFKNHPNLLLSYIPNDQAAMGVLVGMTFVIVLLFVSLLTMKIADMILNSSASALDRSLGFVFGMARGLVLMCIIYIFYAFYFDKSPFPQVTNAYSRPFVEDTSETIKNYLVGMVDQVKDRMEGDSDE